MALLMVFLTCGAVYALSFGLSALIAILGPCLPYIAGFLAIYYVGNYIERLFRKERKT